MTDEPTAAPRSVPTDDAAPSTGQRGDATPEERLAETLTDDPAVGSDGTGMGELP